MIRKFSKRFVRNFYKPIKGLVGNTIQHTFGTYPSTPLSTLITSRKCYFTVSNRTPYTVPAGAEISFDGVTWTGSNGTTPTGAKWWQCRFTSSDLFSDPLTKTPTLNGVDYPFTVITRAVIESIIDFGGDPLTMGGDTITLGV